MEKLQLQVEVSKEAYELAQALVKMASAVKKAVDDGWQPAMDIPMIVLAAVKELPVAVAGVDQLDDEFKGDPAAFAHAFLVSAADLAKLFKKQEA